MSAQENEALTRLLNDLFNARDWDRAAALTAEDAVIVNMATGDRFTGPAGLVQFMHVWADAFQDATAETVRVVADETGAAMEFVGRGTHTGALVGPEGEIPATGKTVEITFSQFLKMRDGKLIEARLYFDLMGMLVQLGIVPVPAAA